METKRFFRNKITIHDQDVDSLWQLNAYTNKLVLVDDDQYISEPFSESDTRFYEVDDPFPMENYLAD